jgi:hypothetical protein
MYKELSTDASSMKDKVAYRRILDILKDVERVDSKLILWELLAEAYESEILHEPSNRNKILDEIEQRKKGMIEALEDAVPEC